jgi:hypothetical protein
MKHVKRSRLVCAIGALLALALSASPTAAQGVATAAVTGNVRDAQGVIPGATMLAVHLPSGSTYEGVTQADGRFFIPGMRVGGVTVTAGLRVDIPFFGDTAHDNPNVDALTFRDETGAAVRYNTGTLPDRSPSGLHGLTLI